MDHCCTLVEVLAILDLLLKSVAEQTKKICHSGPIAGDVGARCVKLEFRRDKAELKTNPWLR